MAKKKAATRQKRITRGPRKGQVITVYAKSGTEVRKGNAVVTGRGRNRQKGSPRAGKKFTRAIDSKGREVHVYGNGKKVVVKHKPIGARLGKADLSGGRYSTNARKAAVSRASRRRGR